MAHLALMLVKDVIDAYVERNADKAFEVWNRDEELDEMYSSVFREFLTYMMEDSRNISAYTHLLFAAKNIERIGDHATNIAEDLWYLVYGTPLNRVRRKGDNSSLELFVPKREPRKVEGK
jgi:phosphate transport system protein